MRVLLVDDSKATRLLIRRTLIETGVSDLQFAEASNGSDGLIRATQLDPNLILSDWMMPEMSGVDLLRELRARKLEISFGFVTVDQPSPHMLETAQAAGAQFLLGGPLSPELLLDALQRHVLGR